MRQIKAITEIVWSTWGTPIRLASQLPTLLVLSLSLVQHSIVCLDVSDMQCDMLCIDRWPSVYLINVLKWMKDEVVMQFLICTSLESRAHDTNGGEVVKPNVHEIRPDPNPRLNTRHSYTHDEATIILQNRPRTCGRTTTQTWRKPGQLTTTRRTPVWWQSWD